MTRILAPWAKGLRYLGFRRLRRRDIEFGRGELWLRYPMSASSAPAAAPGSAGLLLRRSERTNWP
eukprot:scaffold2364_cov126-Isochrysis_galbana.AAC.1